MRKWHVFALAIFATSCSRPEDVAPSQLRGISEKPSGPTATTIVSDSENAALEIIKEAATMEFAKPRLGTIAIEAEIKQVVAKVLWQTPEFVIEPEDVPILLRHLRLATGGDRSLDSLAESTSKTPEPVFYILIILNNGQKISIKSIADVNGPLLYSMNGLGYARTNDGTAYRKGDYIRLYGKVRKIPSKDHIADAIAESISFKNMLVNLYLKGAEARKGGVSK